MKNKVKKIGIIAFLSIFFIYIFGQKNSTIICKIVEQPCPDAFTEKITRVLTKKSFFFTDLTYEFQTEPLNSQVYLLEKVEKKLPSTLILTFSQEKALYVVHQNGEYFVSQSGKILPNAQTSDQLLSITFLEENKLVTDSTLNKDYHLLFATIAEKINKHTFVPAQVEWKSDQEITLFLPNMPKILLDIPAIQTKLDILDTIVYAREIEDRKATVLEIDMRFNLPVLRMKQ